MVSYTYDSTGNITEIKDPAGIITRYEYDLLSRMTCIHSGQGMNVQYGYDSLDRIEHIHYGNGVQTNYAYDCDGKHQPSGNQNGKRCPAVFDYQYDGNGNRTAKTGIQELTAGSSALTSAISMMSEDSCWKNAETTPPSVMPMTPPETSSRKTEGEKKPDTATTRKTSFSKKKRMQTA